jgi:hypothetical protein
MNSNVANSQPPPRPVANADVDNAALAAQVLETGSDEKCGVAEAVEQDASATPKVKKIPQAGIKNYFVSTLF